MHPHWSNVLRRTENWFWSPSQFKERLLKSGQLLANSSLRKAQFLLQITHAGWKIVPTTFDLVERCAEYGRHRLKQGCNPEALRLIE